jgi:hypothetical protein
MKNKKEFKEIVLPNKGHEGHNPYTLAFVYAENGNLLVKGYIQEVNEYLKTLGQKYFTRYTFYNQGEHRGHWKFYKDGVYISTPDIKRRKKDSKNKYEFVSYITKPITTLKFKRIPNRWIPEFNNL